MITGLEQEALLVIFGIIRDVEHGPEVAVFNLGAFSLARSEVHYIVIVNVYNIVQCDWASTISKWAKWIWFLSCWNRKYEVWENIYYVEEYVLKIDEENETRTNPKNNQDIWKEKNEKLMIYSSTFITVLPWLLEPQLKKWGVGRDKSSQ